MRPFHPPLDARTRALAPVLSPGLARLLLRLLVVAVLLAWQLAVAAPAHAKAGDLDRSFGTGGKVTTDFAGDQDTARALVVQGTASSSPPGAGRRSRGGLGDFALARYNPDGSLDTTFGTGGKVTTDFPGGGDGQRAGRAGRRQDRRRRPRRRQAAATSPWPATTPTAAWTPPSGPAAR